MPDREKVIAQLTADMDVAKLTGESLVHITRETVMETLAILREQEPVKPKRVSTIVDTITHFVCGSCEMPIGLTDHYCRLCGRKVKRDG